MDRSTKNALLMSMLGGLALSANAWGQGDPKRSAMDSDGDGLVSVMEHADGARAMFERIDADHDGYVTATEMDAGHAMMMKSGAGMHGGHSMPGHARSAMPRGGMMAMMDSNRDGAITAQEHAVGAKSMFDSLDTDGDGKVTAAEIAAAHRTMMQAGQPMHHGPGKQGMQGMAGMGMGMGRMSSAGMLRQMDRDGDGRVSATEHAAGARSMFDEADTNKDGTLSEAERAAHHARMMKRDMAPGDDMN